VQHDRWALTLTGDRVSGKGLYWNVKEDFCFPNKNRPDAVSSAKGAKCKSLGQRPRTKFLNLIERWKRWVSCTARCCQSQRPLVSSFRASRVRLFSPGALPQAFIFRAFGALNVALGLANQQQP